MSRYDRLVRLMVPPGVLVGTVVNVPGASTLDKT